MKSLLKYITLHQPFNLREVCMGQLVEYTTSSSTTVRWKIVENRGNEIIIIDHDGSPGWLSVNASKYDNFKYVGEVSISDDEIQKCSRYRR